MISFEFIDPEWHKSHNIGALKFKFKNKIYTVTLMLHTSNYILDHTIDNLVIMWPKHIVETVEFSYHLEKAFNLAMDKIENLKKLSSDNTEQKHLGELQRRVLNTLSGLTPLEIDRLNELAKKLNNEIIQIDVDIDTII